MGRGDNWLSQFTTPLVMDKIGEKEWILLKTFEYHVGCYPSTEIIIVPEGFHTDLASIPKIFWPILPPDGPYGKAALVHDYCYRFACYNRKRSDEIFLEGMEVLKVEEWKQTTMFHSVRLFGWHAWNKRRKEQYEHG